MHYKLKDFSNSKYPYFTRYKSIPHQTEHTINKIDIPVTKIEFIEENHEEINNILKSVIELISEGDLIEGFTTPSGGIKSHLRNKLFDCYFIHKTRTYFEITITSSVYGCFRFNFGHLAKLDPNAVSGQGAIHIIYGMAKKHNVIDVFKENAVDKETGLQIKEEIKSPVIEVENKEYLEKQFDNVHHIDLNSSYASRIVEAYPELKPMYKELYDQRKDNNGRYKSVLTNSIGAFQSEYCIDVNTNNGRSLYQMSKFAKIAVNGTRDKILEIRDKMIEKGFKPLLYNTDGIWYQSNDETTYHDNEEGTDLCQWKHDHTNCKLYIKSKGAYQYLENGKVNTTLRGYCELDKIKPREQWEWREIDKKDAMPYSYDIDLLKGGVYKVTFDELNEIDEELEKIFNRKVLK